MSRLAAATRGGRKRCAPADTAFYCHLVVRVASADDPRYSLLLRKVIPLEPSSLRHRHFATLDEIAAHVVDLQVATTGALIYDHHILFEGGVDVGFEALDADRDAVLIAYLRSDLGFIGSDTPAYRALAGLDA
jgi:hypothetical protein